MRCAGVLRRLPADWQAAVELCGAPTETCPPGMKTGDAISRKDGYKGGGMQMLVDFSIGPARPF
jgi:hypothetical protein